MYGAIKILLDYANGKGFDVIDGGTACLNAIGVHDFCKQVDHIHNLAIKESRQDVVDMCVKAKADIKEVLKDISDLSKSYGGTKEIEKMLGDLPMNKMMSVLKSKAGRDDAEYLAKNLYNTEKSAMAFIGLHEREKMLDQLIYTAEREGMTETVEIAKKLQSVFDDMYKIINGKIKIDDDTLLKKYSQNISKCIKENDMILTLDNGVTDKNLIGNKGANLVEMHKLGINVPQSLFLTTIACKSIHEQDCISFMPLLKNILYMFDTDLIAIRSSGVVSMAGMMDTVLDVNRTDEKAVTEAIMSVVKSWDSERAKSFRKVCKIDDEIKVSIVIQGMIRGDEGCSGIVFSRNPNDGDKMMTGEFLDKALGDGLASGKVTPLSFDLLDTDITIELTDVAIKLEKHFKHIQDIEFVNDGKQTYIVQTRNAKLSPLAEIKTLIDFYNEGFIELPEFKARYRPEIHKQVVKITAHESSERALLLIATPAVNGVFTGKVCFDRTKADENSILVVDITTPDDMPYLHKIGGLITNIGGVTSHPAVVCRQLKKPCVVGAKKDNTKHLVEGETITIVGDTGKIYLGEVSIAKKQMFVDEVNEILKWEE